MDLHLQGRIALVTGASQGIGRSIARNLALEGVTVAASARRESLVQELAREVAAEGGGRIIPLAADLLLPDAGSLLAAKAIDALGHVDILMNVAGLSFPLRKDAGNDVWHEAFTLNFHSVRELTTALLPTMTSRKWGRIVNFTAIAEPLRMNAAGAAKAAVQLWAKALSRQVAAEGITINCIEPGRIRSEQVLKAFPTEQQQEAFARTEIPMLRFGDPGEVADLAVFLASARAGYITGTSIPVDGGWRRHAF